MLDPLSTTKAILLIILSIDTLVRKPLGIDVLRRLAGYTDHGLPTKACAWDLEGKWQIGTMSNGRSPWQWTSVSGLGNDDQHRKNGNGNHGENKNLHGWTPPHPAMSSDQRSLTDKLSKRKKHDYVRSRERSPTNFDNSTVIPYDDKNHINVSLGTITCADLGTNPAASFVADPFLLKQQSSSNDDEWYIFFELKNLQRYIGEIGVSKSIDGGQSWDFQGVALQEKTFHLSYPFVIKDDKTHKYYMIPETNQAGEVRVYETSEHDFPFGWVHVHTPLKGQRFVDTAAVWHDGRYWVYTTVLPSAYNPFSQRKTTLKLYFTDDLLGTWTEHPQSPIVTKNSQIGRSGGRPVVYRDHVYRFAQDGTRSYGEGVHVIRAHVLTLTLYQEQQMTFISPKDLGVARFHHVDAHVGGDGKWFALIDTDEHGENYEYFKRESGFYYFKRVCLGLLIWLHLLKFLSWFAALDIFVVERLKMHFRKMCSSLVRRIQQSKHQARKGNTRQKKDKAFIFANKELLRSFGIAVLLSAAAFLILVIVTDLGSICVETGSMSTDGCFSGHLTFIDNVDVKLANVIHQEGHSNMHNDDLVVVTAASSAFMERLRNFVGSLHYWEPHLNLTIYDLGLAEADLLEISQWKRVQVKTFPFDQYPVHVSLLYNFAWKIVMLHEALKLYPWFIYFDSGMEIRRPLTDVRYYLKKDGYYGIQLRGGTHLIGGETHPTTYEKMRGYGLDFDIDEVKRSPFCAGGVQGMVQGRIESLLEAAMRCAMEEECINPKGCGRSNHNWDQSALSIAAYATGRGGYCHVENIVDNDPLEYTMDETRCNHVLMGTRRWRLPKKYKKHIDKHSEIRSNSSTKGGAMSVEMYQQGMMKPQGDSKWQECLRNCKKDSIDDNDSVESRLKWNSCVQKCPLDHGADGIVLMDIFSILDYFLTRMRKSIRCKTILLRIVCIWIVSMLVLLRRARRNICHSLMSKDKSAI